MLHALDSVAEVHSCRASSLGSSSCLPRFDVLIVSAEDFADAAGYAGVSLAADEEPAVQAAMTGEIRELVRLYLLSVR